MSLFMMIVLLMVVPGIALTICRFDTEIYLLERGYYSVYLIRKVIITGVCLSVLPLWFMTVCGIEYMICRDIRRSVIVNARFVRSELFSGFSRDSWNRI